jgi:hypothetical protein
MKIRLIIITFAASIYSYAQSIEKFSIDSGGASVSAGNIEVLHTIGEVNIAERTSASVSASEGFINPQSRVLLELLAFLQGPLLNPVTPGLMNDDLRAANYLPNTSPYPDGAIVSPAVLSVTGSNAIVDWVWIELRLANDNTKIVNAKSALLQRNGVVVEVDGVSNIQMNASPTNYYVVIKHRNHLGVMSANPIALSKDEELVDFIDSNFTTFGSNARVQLASGFMALWAGDVSSDNAIRFSGANNDVNTIKDLILADPLNFLGFTTFSSQGYLLGDLDLNGVTRFSGAPNDSNIVKDNVLIHPGNFLGFPTYTINTTVPNEN